MVEPPSESQRRASGLEWWLGYGALLAVALIPALAKGQDADATTNSPIGELVWSVVYLLAAIRLLRDRAQLPVLFRHSALLLAFVLFMILSTLWSVAPMTTFKNAIELAGTTVVAYYLVVNYPLRRLLDLIGITFGTIAVLSLLVIVLAPGHGRMDWGSGAWSGVFQEKNNLGAAMILAIIALLPRLFSAGRHKFLAIATAVLCLGLLAGSRSATAFAAGLVAIVIGLSASFWYSPRTRASGRVALLAIAVVAIAVACVVGFQPDLALGVLGRSSTLTGRTDFWPYLVQAIGDRPLLGYGYNAFFGSSVRNEYLSYYVVEAGGWTPYHAHDSFLQIAIDGGYVGLGLFATLLVGAIVRCVRYIALKRELAAAWPLMVVLFLILGSYTETYLGNCNTFEWIFFVAAILYPIRSRAAVASSIPILLRPHYHPR